MKSKKNKLINKKMEIKKELKSIDKDGYPIKRKKICSQCNKKFVLTFSFSQQNYSKKHFLFFWTEKLEDKNNFTCSSCVRSIYTNQESRKQLSLEKRRFLSSYIAQGIV